MQLERFIADANEYVVAQKVIKWLQENDLLDKTLGVDELALNFAMFIRSDQEVFKRVLDVLGENDRV